MDPLGFAMENFDWTGRWRDKEFDGTPIDVSGTLPSGEKFNGPAEFRQVLMNRKDEFLRQLTGKVLGYALGRSLQAEQALPVSRSAARPVHPEHVTIDGDDRRDWGHHLAGLLLVQVEDARQHPRLARVDLPAGVGLGDQALELVG